MNLNHARLPIPPPGLGGEVVFQQLLALNSQRRSSGANATLSRQHKQPRGSKKTWNASQNLDKPRRLGLRFRQREESPPTKKLSSVTNAAARDASASVPEGCVSSGHSAAHSFPRQRLATCLKSLDLDSSGRTARPAATQGLAKRPSRLRITWQIWWNLRILGKFARNSGYPAKPNP